ncbi:MAG: hypothetical protein IJ378_03850 [Alistipes sp.]|nr:hypothetical protein [Alistipes sp.]
MRRLLISLLAIATFLGCSKSEDYKNEETNTSEEEDNVCADVLVDLAPIMMYVYVQNDKGADLLNPNTESSIDVSAISLQYKDKNYSVNKGYSTTTRAYMASFNGVTLKVDSQGRYFLSIGEWNADDDAEYTEISLDWGDGTKDTFGFTNDVTFNATYRNDAEHNYGYTFKRKTYYNGDEVNAISGNSPIFRFVIAK